VRLAAGDLLLPPTPPPDVDLDAWRASLAAIEAWEPERIAITHFGDYGDVPEHLERLRAALTHWSELAGRVDRETYAATLRAIFAEALDEDAARSFAMAMPPDDQWIGLDLYLRRSRESGASG
jgi:glyoxylase-like metal-dependent hydrolase (beta-lactamase superfamily II)